MACSSKKNGKAYVLTSDHVVLHDDDGFCHSVWNPTLGKQKAHYLASDWGIGLALLAVPDVKPGPGWADVRNLLAQLTKKADSVIVTGFPYDADGLVQDAKGAIRDPGDPRPIFALDDTLISIEGAHGEFGMSGGRSS